MILSEIENVANCIFKELDEENNIIMFTALILCELKMLKYRRCKKCSQKPNCGCCINCLDKPIFGGCNKRKKKCTKKKCTCWT